MALTTRCLPVPSWRPGLLRLAHVAGETDRMTSAPWTASTGSSTARSPWRVASRQKQRILVRALIARRPLPRRPEPHHVALRARGRPAWYPSFQPEYSDRGHRRGSRAKAFSSLSAADDVRPSFQTTNAASAISSARAGHSAGSGSAIIGRWEHHAAATDPMRT